MFSKKAIQAASVYLLGDEEIDKEEFLAIYGVVTTRREHLYKHYERIKDVSDAISPEEFQTEFRFDITELPLLLQVLKLQTNLFAPMAWYLQEWKDCWFC